MRNTFRSSGSAKVGLNLELLEDRSVPAVAIPLVASPGGGESKAVIYDTRTETVRAWIHPFGPTVTNFRCAAGDVNGDGVADYIFGTGAGYPPRVMAIDGVTLNVQKPLFSKYAFPVGFLGGVYVAVVNYNGVGPDEIIVGAGAGGGPNVKVFDLSGNTLLSFFAFNPNYSGGVSVSGNDLNADGIDEIITGSATTSSNVKVFDYNPVTKILEQQISFYAFPNFQGGINVASAPLIANNASAQIIVSTAQSTNFSPVLALFSNVGTLLGTQQVYSAGTTGMTVGAIDPSGLGQYTLVTGHGRWTDPRSFMTQGVNSYTFDGTAFVRGKTFLPYGPLFKKVVFVG